MATIDKRLIPLIEALTAEDAGWLAFEFLDGLRQGRVLEETNEELRMTRQAVRSHNWQTRHSEKPVFPPPPAEPIIGDEQIDWAVDYVSNRFAQVLSMLDATFEQLDTILFNDAHAEGQPSSAGMREGVTIVLITDDEERLSMSRA